MSAPDTLNFSSLAGTQTVLDAEVTDGILLFAYKSFYKTHLKCFSCEGFFIGCIVTAALKETILKSEN